MTSISLRLILCSLFILTTFIIQSQGVELGKTVDNVAVADIVKSKGADKNGGDSGKDGGGGAAKIGDIKLVGNTFKTNDGTVALGGINVANGAVALEKKKGPSSSSAKA